MDVFYDSIAIPILAAIAGAVVTVLLGALLRGSEPRSLLTPAIGGAILFVTLWFGYTALDHVGAAQQRAERRALDDRRAALLLQTSEPGSALGCLDGMSGDTVEKACASAVFATPESVAAAVGHAAARLTLLADSLAYAKRFDPSYEAAIADLRRAAENDAFGLYSHVLAVRDGCTADRCAAFALLGGAGMLKDHLIQHTYEFRVAENSLRWRHQVTAPPPAPLPAVPAPSALLTPPATPAAPAPASTIAAPTTAVPTTAAPTTAAPTTATVAVPPHGIVPPAASVLPNIEFPSSASIPPVSIMSPEPRASTGAAAAAAEAPAGQEKPALAPKPVPLPRSAPRPHPQQPQTQPEPPPQ
jgi:hypothetical protein